LPVVYDELRILARSQMRRERQDHTLETGALIHEAYLRLIDQERIQWSDRKHFYGILARTMRRILVEHARGRASLKRGGDFRIVSLEKAEKALQAGREVPADLVELDDALDVLAETDPEKSRLVELRFFAGLNHREIAELLGVSISTIDRQWRVTRAWLYDALR
jgi:RNA polymerase sigma factor (TIGR02999 family)